MDCCVFVGCSFTQGVGFELLDKEPGLWVNLLHKNVDQLSKTKLINNGAGGLSNERVFYTAVNSIVKHTPKYIFVQWTSAPRYRITLGVETTTVDQYFSPNKQINYDIPLHSIKYSASYLNSVKDRFLSLHHPHGDIVTIIEYTNSLINLANKTGTQIFFINGLCPWDDNYFTKLQNVLPSCYTNYTQKLIESTTRADSETFAIYDKMHTEYTQAGSIQESYWLNLYWSFRHNMIDKNNDRQHPGIKSNLLYFNNIKSALLEKI